VVAALCAALAAALMRHFIIAAEVWVSMAANMLATLISAMSLSGVNKLKRRKGVKEFFFKKRVELV
jgi:membrane protein YdbS with pleckstrin-like domain